VKKVLIDFDFPEEYQRQLKAKYNELEWAHCLDRKSILEHAKDTHILISFLPYHAEIIDAAPELEWIQTLTAGVDYMDLDKIDQRSILLTCGRGIHKIHMTEFAIAAMINLARGLHFMFRNQIRHKWDRTVTQGEIHGATLGIIGLGDIGREIAKKASFMGMRVIGVKRKPETVANVEHVYDPENMAVVFKESDYVINLLPYSPVTKNLIDSNCFQFMKAGACFINIGRGRTVNEADLIEALQTGKIRAMVSDVFFDEPLGEENPLWSMENVIITPHICGVSIHYMQKAMHIIKHNLNAYVRGKGELINIVDLKSGY
jgi:phosphoglycerate dehydrogenase-like enzyme